MPWGFGSACTGRICLAEPIRRAVVGAATTEDEVLELVLRHKPSLLICSSDLETG